MKLHIAEINALKSTISELGGSSEYTVFLQKKLEALKQEDRNTVERLVPSAIKLIEYRFNGRFARIRYKESGVECVIVRTYGQLKPVHYVLFVGGKKVMSFADIESLARFLIVSEDIILETSLERE